MTEEAFADPQDSDILRGYFYRPGGRLCGGAVNRDEHNLVGENGELLV